MEPTNRHATCCARSRRAGRTVLSLLLPVTFVACGGSGEGTADPSTTSSVTAPAATTVERDAPRPPSTQIVTTTDAASRPTTAAPVPSPSSVSVDAAAEPRIVASVVGDMPVAGGWRMPAGVWRSTAFTPDLRFDIGADYLLVNQSPDAIDLAPIDGDRSHRLSILIPNAVGGDAGIAVAVPEDAIDYLEGLGEGGYIDLEHVERTTATDGTPGFIGDFRPYALATRGLGPLTTYPCALGPDCIYIMHPAAGTDIHAVEGEPVRIVGRTIDGRPYRVVARGAAGPEFDRLSADAIAIADSLELLDDDVPAQSPQLLATVGSRTERIPPGDFVARLGDAAVVELAMNDSVGPVALDFGGEERITLRVADVATVALLAPQWIDPDAPQTADHPPPTDLLDRRIETTADYAEWRSVFFEGEEAGRLTISGHEAVRFAGPLRNDAPTWACGDRPGHIGTQCVWLYVADGWWYGNDDPTTAGHDYHIDGTGLLMIVDPDDDSTDVAGQIQPLLDAITIRLLESTRTGQ